METNEVQDKLNVQVGPEAVAEPQPPKNPSIGDFALARFNDQPKLFYIADITENVPDYIQKQREAMAGDFQIAYSAFSKERPNNETPIYCALTSAERGETTKFKVKTNSIRVELIDFWPEADQETAFVALEQALAEQDEAETLHVH
jgi:hypothetical protein